MRVLGLEKTIVERNLQDFSLRQLRLLAEDGVQPSCSALRGIRCTDVITHLQTKVAREHEVGQNKEGEHRQTHDGTYEDHDLVQAESGKHFTAPMPVDPQKGPAQVSHVAAYLSHQTGDTVMKPTAGEPKSHTPVKLDFGALFVLRSHGLFLAQGDGHLSQLAAVSPAFHLGGKIFCNKLSCSLEDGTTMED
jgi:hypothetical protein